jgi:site-specific recombinase XerD
MNTEHENNTALTTTTPAAIVAQSPFDAIAALVLDTVSERTQRDYRRALVDFMAWYVTTGQTALTKATVQAHIAPLKATGVAESSINQRLAAIRKLAREAADNELIPERAAQAIGRVANIKRQGQKLGNWLNHAQATAMVNAPDPLTLKGKRDRAILAGMLGAGLRRDEVARLTVGHLQQREGRWVILDLVGKHNRTRTVPIAPWIKSAIDKWTEAAAITAGLLFRPVKKEAYDV